MLFFFFFFVFIVGGESEEWRRVEGRALEKPPLLSPLAGSGKWEILFLLRSKVFRHGRQWYVPQFLAGCGDEEKAKVVGFGEGRGLVVEGPDGRRLVVVGQWWLWRACGGGSGGHGGGGGERNSAKEEEKDGLIKGIFEIS